MERSAKPDLVVIISDLRLTQRLTASVGEVSVYHAFYAAAMHPLCRDWEVSSPVVLREPAEILRLRPQVLQERATGVAASTLVAAALVRPAALLCHRAMAAARFLALQQTICHQKR